MTNIAAVIYSEPGVPAGESFPASTTPGEQPFDELLAALPGGVPAVPMNIIAPLPSALTPLPESEAVAPPAPAVCLEGEAVAGDCGAEPAPEDNVALLSSCLAMWQFLPLPGPQPAGVDVVVEEVSHAAVSTENIPSPIRSGEPFAARPAVAAATPVEVRTEFPQPPILAALRPGAPAATLQNETPVTPAPESTPAMPAASTPVPAPPVPAPAPSAPAPAPDGGPISAVLPAVAAAVESNPSTRAILARVAKAEPVLDRVEIKASQALERLSETAPAVGDGIPVAKEQRAMQDPVIQPSAKRAPAAFAEGETQPVAARGNREGPVQASPAAGGSPFQDERQNEMSGDQREPAAPAVGVARSGGEIDPGINAVESEAAVEPSEVAQVIQQIERAVERMRSQGGERIEMRVPLQDGGEVVVKIRVEHGEVKATFQSSADGLQQALESGWSQLAQVPAERIGKAAPVVFESPSMQSGTGGFQQSSDQRERNERGRPSEAHFVPMALPSENKKTNEARRSAIGASASSSLEIYA